MDRNIQLALDRPPDYSHRFTERMQSYRDLVSRSLGVSVKLDSDMNYSASQEILVYLDEELRWCDPKADTRAFRIRVFVSSKGPFFTCVYRHRISRNEWRPLVGRGEESDKLEDSFMQVRRVLEIAGLTYLHRDDLQELAVGHVTMMDGVPATVFEVLFDENV